MNRLKSLTLGLIAWVLLALASASVAQTIPQQPTFTAIVNGDQNSLTLSVKTTNCDGQIKYAVAIVENYGLLVFVAPNFWVPWPTEFPEYRGAPNQDGSITLLFNSNVTGVHGTLFLAGCGWTVDDMLDNRKFSLVLEVTPSWPFPKLHQIGEQVLKIYDLADCVYMVGDECWNKALANKEIQVVKSGMRALGYDETAKVDVAVYNNKKGGTSCLTRLYENSGNAVSFPGVYSACFSTPFTKAVGTVKGITFYFPGFGCFDYYPISKDNLQGDAVVCPFAPQ